MLHILGSQHQPAGNIIQISIIIAVFGKYIFLFLFLLFILLFTTQIRRVAEDINLRLSGFRRGALKQGLLRPKGRSLSGSRLRTHGFPVQAQGVAQHNVIIGTERKGTPRLLMEFGEKYGFDVEILSKEMDGHRKISSTYIREELKKGNMEKVTSLMGRDYFVEGQVVHGRGMGHKVLLPTTNLVPPRTKILPPNGVYVTSSYFGDKIYHGITNIGCKPTVGESFIGVETYLFDCKEDLYGEECRVDFKKFLRPERKFPSLEALKSRLLADAEDGRRFFEKTEK